MKVSVVLWLCMLAMLSRAQTLRTFNSPDSLFRFKYSPILVDCMPILTRAAVPASILDACSSQPGMCDNGEGTGNTIACLGYPKERFKDKPTFIAATFSVAEIKEAKTEKICLEGSELWNMNAVKIGRATINGVSYKVFDRGDMNWLGGSQRGLMYRAFHQSQCFELGLQTAGESGGYPPEVLKRFTKKDAQEVDAKLKEALHSFEFLK